MLNLSRNNISTIEGLKELTLLRVLDLSYNRITKIGHGNLLIHVFSFKPFYMYYYFRFYKSICTSLMAQCLLLLIILGCNNLEQQPHLIYSPLCLKNKPTSY